jgi:hypothetical protein
MFSNILFFDMDSSKLFIYLFDRHVLKLALYYPIQKAGYNGTISTTYSKKRPVVENLLNSNMRFILLSG